MRSVDVCLGLPSDIVLYATLLLLLAHDTGYKPGTLTFMLGDTHVYANHVDTAREQLQRAPGKLPEYRLNTLPSKKLAIDTFVPVDLSILDYQPQGALKYVLNV